MAAPKITRERKSSIDRLPKEVRELIKKLRSEDGATIDEILDHLRKLNVQVGRTALGKHTKTLDEMSEHIRQSRIVAEAMVTRFGADGDDKLARANLEMLQSSLLRLQMAAHSAMEAGDEDGQLEIPFSPKEMMMLSKTVQQLASAEKATTDRIVKAQEQGRKEAEAAARKKLDQAGQSGELDPEALRRAKRIMGFD